MLGDMFRILFQAIRTILKIHKDKIVVTMLLLNEQVLRYQTPFHYAGLQAKFGLHVSKNKFNTQNEE